MYRRSLAIAVLVTSGSALAERVPDASLRAVTNRVVRLELDAGVIEGRLLGFEASTVTIAITATNEVLSIERGTLARVIVIDAEPAGPPPERARYIGAHLSLLGTVAVDVDYKNFHAFVSTNLLFPVLTAGGSGTWFTAGVGAGGSWKLGDSRWRLDIFAQALPLRTTSYYTYLGVGIGAGFHYTARSGFNLGFTFPVIGFAARFGESTYGYDASFRYNDSLAYYYFAAVSGMPILTMGYRFGSRSISNSSSTSRSNAASSK